MRGPALAVAGSVALAALAVPSADAEVLRVCADPDNLPYSNAAGQGYENRMARLLAADLGRELELAWWPLRRGFVRNTLGAKLCDALMGVPVGLPRVRTTRAYYRSGYMLVVPTDRGPQPRSLEAPELRSMRIGVQLVGDDYSNTPPVHALSARGIIGNLRGFPVYGDEASQHPAAAVVRAVATGDVDVAIVWGPLAGYLVRRQRLPLELVPLGEADGRWPLTFAMAIGVRPEDGALADDLDRALGRNTAAIADILEGYGVPRMPLEERP